MNAGFTPVGAGVPDGPLSVLAVGATLAVARDTHPIPVPYHCEPVTVSLTSKDRVARFPRVALVWQSVFLSYPRNANTVSQYGISTGESVMYSSCFMPGTR